SPERTAPFRRDGEGCTEKQNSEIGVRANLRGGGARCREDSRSDPFPRLREGPGRDQGASLAVVDHHAVTVRIDKHGPALQRIEFRPARGAIGPGDPGWRKSCGHCDATSRTGAAAPRTDSRNDRATTSAMSISVTRCRPDQAGMLLTSSTR